MKKKLFFSIMVATCLTCSSCLTMQGTSAAAPTTGNTTQQGQLAGIIGNILSSVTGGMTTTQANLIGTWTYTQPCVQFESDNLLAQAGGAAAATKVETRLETVYKMAGITPGKLVFTFDKEGNVSYTVGSRKLNGTYVFDAQNKTVVITTATGMKVTAYVTISGNNMSLCFDSSKVLSLFSAVGDMNISDTLSNISGVIQNFKGMKTGFKFKR